MHFKLRLKDGLKVTGGEQKGKPGIEALLEKKFGNEDYQSVRKAIVAALESWKI